MKVPNFTFCRGQEQSLIDNNFLFLFLNFDTVLNNSTPKKFANIWQMKRDGICPITFEAVRNHLLIIHCHCCLSSLINFEEWSTSPWHHWVLAEPTWLIIFCFIFCQKFGASTRPSAGLLEMYSICWAVIYVVGRVILLHWSTFLPPLGNYQA